MGSNILRIIAGREAYDVIQTRGLQADDVSAVVSAAGGPKWFTVYGLTRYIIGAFLSSASQKIHFMGASVGSWQMAAALARDPVGAIDRLRAAYAEYHYQDPADAKDISKACRLFIDEMIGKDASHMLNHSNRILHVITARGRGLLSSPARPGLLLGFGSAYLMNLVNRKWMNATVQRTVFSTESTLPFSIDEDALTTMQQRLTDDNLRDVLQASGTIPFMMQSKYHVGQSKGAYWDGGMTDYHISLPYDVPGLVLQPHFYPFVYPGWFDKKIPWNRYASPAYMSKVVLITPSPSYIDRLPLGRISQMKDVKHFGSNQSARIAYWTEVSERSLELGGALEAVLRSGDIGSIVEPYSK